MATVLGARLAALHFCPVNLRHIYTRFPLALPLRTLLRLSLASSVLTGLLTTVSFAAEPRWISIQNDNFQVYSTAGERKTRAALNQFERVRSFFNQLARTESNKSNPVTVVIFDSEKQYKPFRPNAVAAAYYSNLSGRDLIVIGQLDDASSQFASHEYTHLVLNRAGYSLPLWLNEGLAEFFSTLGANGGEVEFGGVLPGHLYALNTEPWVPLHTILFADNSSPYYNETKKAGSLYSQSWALVHMLNNTEKYRAKFWPVVETVNAGTPSVQALTDLYGIPFAELERELQAYIAGNRFLKQRIKIELDETERLAIRPADMFEVREVQAALWVGLPGKQAAARKSLEELTRENAKRPEPWADLGYLAWHEGNQGEAIEHFTKAVELGNRSPRLLLNFAQLAGQNKPEAAGNALKTLLEMEPNNLDARLLLANVLLGQDRFTEAAIATRSITHVKTTDQRDNLLYMRAYAAMRLGYTAESRSLAEELKEVTASMDFRMRATQILRTLEGR